jgi:hypothetical protein
MTSQKARNTTPKNRITKQSPHHKSKKERQVLLLYYVLLYCVPGAAADVGGAVEELLAQHALLRVGQHHLLAQVRQGVLSLGVVEEGDRHACSTYSTVEYSRVQ